jgi:D-glycero-alpha-D-manno-heptose-7-phosphate kinase
MIIARAPLRIPLAGGGTDLPFYARGHGGYVLSVAINLYTYAILIRRSDSDGYLVCSDRMQLAQGISRINHPYIREVLRYLDVPCGLEIHCRAEVAGGSGLGVSSSVMVALLRALHTLRGERPGAADIAREATRLEREVLRETGGVQDQYITAYGGLQEIRNTTSADVRIAPLQLEPEVTKALETNLLLFSTGMRRHSGEILQSQLEQNTQSSIIEKYDKIKQIGLRARDDLLAGDLHSFARALHEHWTIKRQLSDRVSSELLDTFYQRGLENGALGGKVVGAGGGGCLVFYVDERHDEFVRKMESRGLRNLQFRFSWKGAENFYAPE